MLTKRYSEILLKEANLQLQVDVSKSITTMIRTPIFECYVVRFVSRNWHRKGTCFKDGLMSFESDEIDGYAIMGMIWSH